jgi:hypothetical protein
MTAKILRVRDVLERVKDWPEEAQTELAQIALEIDAGLGQREYQQAVEILYIHHAARGERSST